MKKVKLRRLANLLYRQAALEATNSPEPHVKYNQNTFVNREDGLTFTNANSCGTSACAFGLAAISGAFKKDGLYYNQQRYPHSKPFTLNGRSVTDNLKAGAQFFGLTENQAIGLFGGSHAVGTTYCLDGPASAIYVAEKIERLIGDCK